jgi:2-phosphosulfolactate phosphatase
MIEVRIESLLEGAKRATGIIAVIDVFRAFTTAAVAFANGAEKIIMVSRVEEALSLRANGTGQICMGEVGGRAPPEFDYGNSPFEITGVDFTGKTLIQRTSAGTQGMTAANPDCPRFAASLVTASATARAMAACATDRITLVAMGQDGEDRTDEDEVCAIHLRNLLQGRPGNRAAVQNLILAGGEVNRFHDPSRPHLHQEDVQIALDIDRYDFAIRVTLEDNRPVARMQRNA